MSTVKAFAPGKLLLIGEYAVLDGAPALVMAVDRLARVSITSAPEGAGRLDAPQLGIERAGMYIEADALRCSGVPADRLGLTGRLVPGIFRALDREPDEIRSLNLEIDTSELFEPGDGRPVKLGLGSSAAVCAALVAGLDAWFKPEAAPPETRARLRKWLPVYRDALASRASGADLAAAFAGGLVEYRDSGYGGSCRARQLPQGLYWRAVWTRQPARTTDFVGAFEAWKRARPEPARHMLGRLCGIARQAVSSLDDADALIEACAAYGDVLVSMGDAMGKEIMSAPHARLARFGRRCGVVYKSCGAGGGDLGIALATDPQDLERFEQGTSGLGGVPLNLSQSETGAGVARRRSPAMGEGQ